MRLYIEKAVTNSEIERENCKRASAVTGHILWKVRSGWSELISGNRRAAKFISCPVKICNLKFGETISTGGAESERMPGCAKSMEWSADCLVRSRLWKVKLAVLVSTSVGRQLRCPIPGIFRWSITCAHKRWERAATEGEFLGLPEARSVRAMGCFGGTDVFVVAVTSDSAAARSAHGASCPSVRLCPSQIYTYSLNLALSILIVRRACRDLHRQIKFTPSV